MAEATVNHRGNTVVVAASCCKLVLFATAAAAVWQLAAAGSSWQQQQQLAAGNNSGKPDGNRSNSSRRRREKNFFQKLLENHNTLDLANIKFALETLFSKKFKVCRLLSYEDTASVEQTPSYSTDAIQYILK